MQAVVQPGALQTSDVSQLAASAIALENATSSGLNSCVLFTQHVCLSRRSRAESMARSLMTLRNLALLNRP